MKKWRTLDSKLAFNHQWFTVRQDKVQLPNGRVLDDYFVWLQGDIALVVPVTPNNEFILVRQYRHAVSDILTEYPAGLVGYQEKPEDAARRELLEETGYSSTDMSQLAVFSENPTKIAGRTFVFIAKNARQVAQPAPDENEDIITIVAPWTEVRAMAIRGEIWATPSVAATFIALAKLGLG